MPWKRTKGGYTRKGQKRGGFVKSSKMYEALRRKGYSKKSSAAITNARGSK